jgi:hypothetical protein
MIMKKAVLATILGVSLSAAWAVDWDDDDDFTMLADDGTVVGQGELDDDGLELELVSGYTGFVRFDAGGEMVEGMVNADGTITLYNAEGFVELDDDLSAKGYGLTVNPVDSIAAPAGVVVTPTDPNRDDDDMDDDGNPGVPGSDDDDDGNRDDDDDMNGDDGSAGGDDDADDTSSSSGSTNTSSDDNDDGNDDDGNDDSSGSTDTNSDDDSGDDDGDDN